MKSLLGKNPKHGIDTLELHTLHRFYKFFVIFFFQLCMELNGLLAEEKAHLMHRCSPLSGVAHSGVAHSGPRLPGPLTGVGYSSSVSFYWLGSLLVV